MNRLLVGISTGAALLLGAQSALADGYVRPGLKDHARCASFGGFYVGAHGAWSNLKSHRNDENGFLIDNAGWTSSDDGFGGGVQAGYNLQRSGSCTLWGIEADFSWAKLEGNTPQLTNVPNFNFGISSSIDWTSTVRGRAGIIVENTLLYLTGGIAFADVETRVRRTVPAPGISDGFSFSETQVGFVVGAGLEYALTRNISLKSEALYMNFGDWSDAGTGNPAIFGPPPGNRFSFSGSDEVWTTRTGINIRF